jgi:hypothetical protein
MEGSEKFYLNITMGFVLQEAMKRRGVSCETPPRKKPLAV